MILLILLDSQHELWDSSEPALLEGCREKNRQGQEDDDDDDDDDDDVHDDNDDDDYDEDDDDDDDDDGVDNDDDDKEAEAKREEDAELNDGGVHGRWHEVIVLEEGKKSRCFQQDLNLIELVCTLKNVGLTVLQIFIALDFTSVLTLNLNNNFP